VKFKRAFFIDCANIALHSGYGWTNGALWRLWMKLSDK